MATKAKQTPSVRVSEVCKTMIAELSVAMGISQTEVMQKAIEALKREQFFNQMREDYEAIANDSKAAAILAEENALFDSAVADGIE